MRTKKTSKKDQRIAEEKAALRDRLFDMLVGAKSGHQLQDDGEDDFFIMASVGLEDFAGWMNAAHNYLDFTRTEDWPQSWTDAELKERAFHRDNLRHFETLKTATEHLYAYGFRA